MTTGSPIKDSSFPTLKIGHTIFQIGVLIVSKCASMLGDYPLFEGAQLHINEIFFPRGVIIWSKGRSSSRYDKTDLIMSLIVHDAKDSLNHHKGGNNIKDKTQRRYAGYVEQFKTLFETSLGVAEELIKASRFKYVGFEGTKK